LDTAQGAEHNEAQTGGKQVPRSTEGGNYMSDDGRASVGAAGGKRPAAQGGAGPND
jgi:hypothetical protein